MSKTDVKLLGVWPSPYVNRVQIALALKSIEYEFVEQSFGSKSELLLKSNPVYKKIPVLIHGDNPICESLIIVQYIDENWTNAPSLLPSDPYDRALARFWAAYIDEKLAKATSVAMKTLDAKSKNAACEEIDRILVVLESAFVKCSRGKDFFGGDRIGFVDIALGSCWGWLKVIGIINKWTIFDEAKLPNLLKWIERFYCDDAVKNVMPIHEKLLEFAAKVLVPISNQIPVN